MACCAWDTNTADSHGGLRCCHYSSKAELSLALLRTREARWRGPRGSPQTWLGAALRGARLHTSNLGSCWEQQLRLRHTDRISQAGAVPGAGHLQGNSAGRCPSEMCLICTRGWPHIDDLCLSQSLQYFLSFKAFCCKACLILGLCDLRDG